MIKVKIMGGLGNQLFQYSFYRYIKEVYGYDVLLENSWFEKTRDDKQVTTRDFLLDKFDCILNYADNNDLTRCKHVVRTDRSDDIIVPEDDTYYDGYWQNPGYLKEIEQCIRREITLKDELMTEDDYKLLDEFVNNNSVAIHVRRTDYLTYNHYHICTKEYYAEAVKRISQMISNPVFFVFSDDKEWAEDNMHFDNRFRTVSCNSDCVEWFVMSNAHHHIIANSTFSWWAAWIGKKENQIVVAPGQWMKNKSCNQLLLKEWIVLG